MGSERFVFTATYSSLEAASLIPVELLVSIDSHKMWIYAVDGQLVVPQQVDAVQVPIGDRFQAFVRYD